jgi:LPS export ABC transporter protein LptC
MLKLLSIAAFIFILFVIILSYQGGNEPEQITLKESFMENIQMIHVSSDVVDWTSQMNRVIMSSDNTHSKIRDIKFLFPVNNLIAHSESGTFEHESDDLSLDNNVTATKQDMIIKTDSIFWNSDQKTLHSDSHVLITGDAYVINGEGLKIKDNGNLIVKNNVKALLY